MRSALSVLAAAAALAATVAPAQADTKRFGFAPPGRSQTGFIFPDDPAIGGRITLARIRLSLEVPAGGNPLILDAANFDADLTLPILPDDGGTAIISITGVQEGWTGTGTFTVSRDTTELNGIIQQTLFGAATAPMYDQATELEAILDEENSYVEVEYTPVVVCEADYDGSSAVDVGDIFAFLSDWFAGVPRANWDQSPDGVQVADIFAFLSAWFTGCE